MRINLTVFKKFFSSGAASGILLIICVICSLIIANSSWGSNYEALLSREVGFATNNIHLKYSLLTWVNDGLMAIFFLLVGLEIKRELVEGELSSPKRALLPVFAAVGGAVVPALIFLLINKNTETVGGWGIPMATDIAFALGVLSLLGKRVPLALKIFLAALAIVDDLLAILVIAVFYSANIHWDILIYSAIVFIVMLAMNKLGIKRLIFYLIPGLLLWYLLHHSGIHATIAGVLTAITIPTNKVESLSPLEKLEHALTYPVNFLIMPIFAFANTNIRLDMGMFPALLDNLGLGILIGLFLGKPIGIGLMSWAVVKLGWGNLPRKATWKHIIGLGFLGGIGFTMSIFIALLSFQSPELRSESKFAVLLTSTLAGICGYIFLKLSSRTNGKSDQ